MDLVSPFFIVLCSTGVIFILVGFMMKKFPPKKVNQLYGYRSKSSMKSIDRWKFAQAYSSIELIKSGLVLTGVSLIGLILKISEMAGLVLSLILVILFPISVFIRTEKAIKNKFD